MTDGPVVIEVTRALADDALLIEALKADPRIELVWPVSFDVQESLDEREMRKR